MTLCFDGLHRLHLGYDELGEYGSTNHVELMFDNVDTDQLAMFLYPRACAKVSREKLAITTQFFAGTKKEPKT